MYQNKRVLQESELKILGVAAKKNPTAMLTALLKNSRYAVRNTHKNLLQNRKLSYMYLVASYNGRGTRIITIMYRNSIH